MENKMQKKGLTIVILLILVVLGSMTIPGFISPPPQKTVAIGAATPIINSLIWVAYAKDFFHEGLDVQFKPYQSGKIALRALVNNEVDLATTSEAAFMFNTFKHEALRLVTTLGSADNEVRIVARRDHGIQQPSDLKGKTLATQKGSAVHFFLSRFLTYNFLKPSDINIIYMKADKLPNALIQGEIDAFSMREPYLQQAKNGLGDKAVELAEPGVYTKTHNLVCNKNFVETEQDTLKKVLQTLNKTAQFMENHPQESIEIIAQKRGMTVPKISEVWSNYIFELSLSQSLLTTMEAEARWAIKHGLLSEENRPNYLDKIYTEALAEVKPEAVEIIR